MVLLQLINHLINRYIPSNCVSAKHQFASAEKFFQVSSPPAAQAWKLKPEAKFFPKITSPVGGTLFVGNLQKCSDFAYFRTFLNIFGQNEWHICFSQPILC